jgi:hypothetical protein
MANYKKSVILASMIRTVLMMYSINERKPTISKIMRLIRKNINARAGSSQRQETFEAIKIADHIWKEAVEHFEKKSICIESVSYVVSMYAEDAEGLRRWFGITEKMIEKYAIQDAGLELEPEQNSYYVTDYIRGKIRESLGEKDQGTGAKLAKLAATAKAKKNLLEMEKRAGL